MSHWCRTKSKSRLTDSLSESTKKLVFSPRSPRGKSIPPPPPPALSLFTYLSLRPLPPYPPHYLDSTPKKDGKFKQFETIYEHPRLLEDEERGEMAQEILTLREIFNDLKLEMNLATKVAAASSQILPKFISGLETRV